MSDSSPSPERQWIPTLTDIRLQPDDLKRLHLVLHKANGLVLCSGPAGSGKTTTMYACAHHLQKPNTKLVTIEDPVYGDLPWATRLVCAPEEGLTLPVMMRSAILSEPDAIMIASLDDAQALNLALRAALTRQLVLSQVHAESTSEALFHIVSRNPLPFHVTDIIRLVTNQRLLPKLCAECSRPTQPTDHQRRLMEAAWALHDLPADDLPDSFRQPTGCPACEGKGYLGRIIIAEQLPMSETIADAVREAAPASQLRELAFRAGAHHLAIDGFQKAARGLTSLDDVQQALANDEFFRDLDT